MTLKLKAWGETFELNTTTSTYRNNGNLYVGLYSKEDGPFADLTVNCSKLEDKTWGAVDTNNCPWAIKFIEDNGLGEDTGLIEMSGFCVYPVYRFNMDKIEEFGL